MEIDIGRCLNKQQSGRPEEAAQELTEIWTRDGQTDPASIHQVLRRAAEDLMKKNQKVKLESGPNADDADKEATEKRKDKKDKKEKKDKKDKAGGKGDKKDKKEKKHKKQEDDASEDQGPAKKQKKSEKGLPDED